MKLEGRRKLIHAATAVAAPWVLLVPEPAATLGLTAALVVVLGFEIGRFRSPRLAAAIDRALPGVVRTTEARRLSGAFLLVVGYTVASAAYGPTAAAAGILALAFGDAAAALAGQAWSHRRGRGAGRRTHAGSLACLLTTAGAVAFVLPGSLLIVAAAALTATALERWDPWGMDNVLVPTGVGLVVELLVRYGI
jgi:phytol kinase